MLRRKLEDKLPNPSPADLFAELNMADSDYQKLFNAIKNENEAIAISIIKAQIARNQQIYLSELIEKNDSRLASKSKEEREKEEIEIITAKNSLSTYKVDQQMSPEARNSFLSDLVEALTNKINWLTTSVAALQQNITQVKQTLMIAVGNQWQARQQQATNQLAQLLQAQNLVFQNAQGNLVAANAPAGVDANGQPLPTLAQQLARAMAPANIVNLVTVNPDWVLEREAIQREIEAEIAAKIEEGIDVTEDENGVKFIDISEVEYNKMNFLGHIRLMGVLADNLGIQLSGPFIKMICKKYPNIDDAIQAVKKEYQNANIQDIKKAYNLVAPQAQMVKETQLELAQQETELQRTEKLHAEAEKKLDRSNQHVKENKAKENKYFGRPPFRSPG